MKSARVFREMSTRDGSALGSTEVTPCSKVIPSWASKKAPQTPARLKAV
jgi:hypothetical protein